ncbi:hypothetical protein ACHAWX_002624 [Stephanocyclus meneghinianus]
MKNKSTDRQKPVKYRCSEVKETASGTKVPDKHHNAMTPCCDLVRDIVREIFPSIGEAEKAVNRDDASKNPNEAAKSLLMVDKSSSQPLLGFMICRSLLQERIQMRSDQNNATSTESKTQRIEIDTNSNYQEEANVKRKKKKKKKRKQSPDTGEKRHEGSDQVEARPFAEMTNREENRTLQVLDKFIHVDDQVCPKRAADEVPLADHSDQLKDTVPPPVPYLHGFLDSIIDSTNARHPTSERNNRDINSFAAYLSQKYQSFLETQHSYKKSKSSGDLVNILPTISLQEVQFYAALIECKQCRSSFQYHLQNLGHSDCVSNAIVNLPWGRPGGDEHFNTDNSKGNIVILDDSFTTTKRRPHRLDVSIPVNMDYDKVFDYLAMVDDVDVEAGQKDRGTDNTSRLPCLHLEFRSISIADQQCLQMQPLATSTNGEGEELQYPLNSQDVIHLVKSVILPCGLDSKEMLSADRRLSDHEFEFIVESARRSSADHRKEFYNIQNLLKQMHSLFDDASNTNNRSQFDATTTKNLNQCDEFCEITLKYIGDFLLTITKLSCFVGWSSEYGPHLMECMVNCWSQFDVTLDKLVTPTMKYRGSVLGYCTRPGQVPQMYFNKMIRDNFFEYIGTKMAMIDKLVLYLETTLISPNYKSYRGKMHQAPSPLVRLCVLEAFLSHSYRSDSFRSSAVSVFPNSDDETEFKKLLAARITLSQTVIRSPTKDNIEQKEKQNFFHVKELYASIVESVIAKLVALESGTQSAPDFIKQCHDSYASQRDKAERELNSQPENITPELAAALLNTSRLLTMQWIYLLCMRLSHSSVQFALPPRLDDWMESLSGSDIVRAEPDKDGGFTCDGSGGRRRVSSVLAALLYRWLEARCSEWHAEMTQDELLRSVDFDEPTVREVAAKSGKKKKARKKTENGDKFKKYSTPPPIGSNDIVRIDHSDKNQQAAAIHVNNENVERFSSDDAENQVKGDADEQAVKKAEQEVKVIEASNKFTSSPAKDSEESVTRRQSESNLANAVDKKGTDPEEASSVIEGNDHTTEHTTNDDAQLETKASEPPNEASWSSAKDSEFHIKHNAESKLVSAVDKERSAVREVSPKSINRKKAKKKSANGNILTDSETNNATQCPPPHQEDCNANVHILDSQYLDPTFADIGNNETNLQSNDSKVGAVESSTTSQSVEDKLHMIHTELQPLVHSVESSPTAESHPALLQTRKVSDDSDAKSTAHDVVASDIQPNVGVIDNGNVIPAEDFLVGRMEALLVEIDAIRSRYTMWF